MTGLETYLGEILDGKYRLEKLLGKGGMGAVFLATHLGTERYVALKIIAPQFMSKDEFVERFRREARAAGRLRHPNVVDVTDFGFAQLDGARVAYLVMEYLDGCTLADILDEEKRLSLEWVVDIMEQVCSAVGEAHAQGIVHRDLKPDNIWLEPNRLGGYRVKVLDFGIAKLGDPSNLDATRENDSNTPPETTATMQLDGATQTTAALEQHHTQAVFSHTLQSTNVEVATRVFDAPDDTENAGTLLFPTLPQISDTGASSNVADAATQILSDNDHAKVDDDGDAKTRILDAPPTSTQKSSMAKPVLQTASVGNVTRVGAIIGTPLYMSPEQCRGEQLGARSDIYSLGVIAYQMLAGATPFSGDLTSIIKQHKEVAPPRLREKNKKIPKKVERIVLAALAKDRGARPSSATAFASELRASSEGMGVLVRQAFAFYIQHFPMLLKISLLAHLPVIVIVALQFAQDGLRSVNALPRWADLTVAGILSLLLVIASYLSVSVISGMTVLIVTQLSLAPLRPVQLKIIFATLRKRLRAFITTGLLVTLWTVIGCILFVVPGVIFFVRYSLYAPIVMLEGLKNRTAMQRSAELARRSYRSVIAVVIIQFLIPSLIATMLGRLVGGMVAESSSHGFQIHFGARVVSRLSSLFNIFTVPLLSILTALLYLKLRQLGGEMMKKIGESLDGDEAKLNRWQLRMRDRLTAHSSGSR